MVHFANLSPGGPWCLYFHDKLAMARKPLDRAIKVRENDLRRAEECDSSRFFYNDTKIKR